MQPESLQRPTLHASVFEIERGLFHATYRSDGTVTSERRLPPYQVGASADDAKDRIQRTAQALGYPKIVWDVSPDA